MYDIDIYEDKNGKSEIQDYLKELRKSKRYLEDYKKRSMENE